MPLDPLALPVAAKSAIQTHLWQHCAAVPTSRTRLFLPHRLYRYLGEQRDGKARLGDLPPTGWRCLARTTEGAFVVVDAFETQGKFAHRMHSGRNTEKWAALIRSVRRKDRWANDSYSMRTLVAPAIYSSALWFAGARGNDQIFTLDWNADDVAGSWISATEWETAVSSATSRTVELWRNAKAVVPTSLASTGAPDSKPPISR